MGAVYQGWQKSLRRLVAIKILPPGLDDNGANFAERFQREAQAMARFSHPGIVAVFDAGETADGLLYFVIEYIEGTDVQKMVKTQGPLSPEHALAITAHVCDALAYAHKRGVIHRDIKPANIMVDTEGQVKVADFGLAKVATDDSAAMVTGSHVSMGTMDFMAPEALYGMRQVDQRADLYAVGVMLYQMLTGEVPRGMFDPPSVHRPGIDVRFDAIVARAMQKDPEKRYGSATDIRTDLDKILTQPVPHRSAVQEAPPPLSPAPCRRTRKSATAAPPTSAPISTKSSPSPSRTAPPCRKRHRHLLPHRKPKSAPNPLHRRAKSPPAPAAAPAPHATGSGSPPASPPPSPSSPAAPSSSTTTPGTRLGLLLL
jgi:serine/threonine protein kinase